jgi:branched-chain amino acid aminotransferase
LDNSVTKRTCIWEFSSKETNYQLNFVGDVNTLDNGSQQLSGGVYTTFRTYDHDKVLRLEDHFDRLEQSAKLQECKINLPRYVLRAGLLEIIEHYPNIDVRLRIHCAFDPEGVRIFIMVEPFTPIAEDLYHNGVEVKTIDLQRDNPVSKATSFIDQTREIRKTKPAEIHEYILITKDGTLLEGMTSNVFVVRDGKIWTASQGVLLGITRQMVLEVIASAGIEIVYSGYPVGELEHAEEAFITSASRGVLPVTCINTFRIGNGNPGKITEKIKLDYQNRLQSELRSV